MTRDEPTYDKPRIDKLGVKPGMRVAILGVADADIVAEVRDRTDDLSLDTVTPPADLILFGADDGDRLAQLAELRSMIRSDGAIWVISRKGRSATLRDVDVIAAALAAGLVDNKVVSFSATHTSLRLVVRRADRASHEHATRAASTGVSGDVDTTGGGT